MSNPHLTQRLQAIQAVLIAQRAAAVGMSSVMAGSERETFLREYLQKLFPSHRRFATGVITDAHGHLSGQVDIAVEFGFTPSFPMPATDERLLLAESVALVIEVKSNLSSQWLGMTATGPTALYAFAVGIDYILTRLMSARPDLTSYVR